MKLYAIMYAVHLLLLYVFDKDGQPRMPMLETHFRFVSLNSLDDILALICVLYVRVDEDPLLKHRVQSYVERYYRNGSSPWLREIKLNRRVFMSINRVRAGHSSLKASLSRFNIESTAECECGDGLQTEKHIFWGCKLYKEQRVTKMDICLRTAKKNTQTQRQLQTFKG
jgi:hypothetical protein